MIHTEDRIRELVTLWTNPEPGNLLRIIDVCREVEEYVGMLATVDARLLHRLAVLVTKAPMRLAGCVRTGTQTGNYSREGALEVRPCAATAGWEG
jgi:hypothetical protein